MDLGCHFIFAKSVVLHKYRNAERVPRYSGIAAFLTVWTGYFDHDVKNAYHGILSDEAIEANEASDVVGVVHATICHHQRVEDRLRGPRPRGGGTAATCAAAAL
eukprot:1847137-Pleurochrysis_carterae.AAC.1